MTDLINPTPFAFTPVEDRAVFGQPSASFVVKASFDIAPDQPARPAARQLPFAGDTPFMDAIGRSLAWPNDLVPWKPNTDFFIIGVFHAPEGRPVPEGNVAFRFGPLFKELRIFGPRIATRVVGEADWTVSAPQPVAAVPLRWEFCRGGRRDPRNPYGLGGDPRVVEGVEALRLPLIESVARPGEPDNVAPVPPMFVERRRKLGTRDQDWSLFRAPLPPEDFDPSHVNAAPADQQAADSPAGDETITLLNMHPRHPRLSFSLPGLRARVAVVRRTPEGMVGEEVPMRLDTIGVMPEDDRLVLLWRGVLPLAGGRLDDEIPMAEVSVEPIGAPPGDPDLPRRVLDRFQHGLDVEAAKEAMVEAVARAEIMKLLPGAKLPPDLEAMIAAGGDAAALFDALEKHILETAAALRASLSGG